jgi:hypothetical protein
VAAGAIIVFVVMRGSAAPFASRDSSRVAADSPAANGRAANSTARRADHGSSLPNVTAARETSAPNRTAAPASGIGVPSAGTHAPPSSNDKALSPEAIRAEIGAIKDLSLDDQKAAEAVRRAEALLPRLRSGDDSAAVLWYQGSAYAMQGDTSRSCRTLNKIGSRGNSSIRESVNLLRSQC